MKLTVYRLIHAITRQIDPYTAEDALTILRDDYRFTDDEIRDMGFDYLFDLVEPKEEPMKKKWKVHVREIYEGDFEVEAENEDEAFALACDLDYTSCDLDYINRLIDIKEET